MSGMFDKIVEVLPSLPNELPRIIKQEKSRDDSETDKVVEDADQIELVTEFDEEPVSVYHMDSDARKPDCCMQTTKVQTSLRIHTVQSVPMFFILYKRYYLSLLHTEFQC